MGWKKVKENYRIRHAVQVTEAGICIGSPYIHDLIVIGLDGEIVKPYPSKDRGVNEDLDRYQCQFDADRATLRQLVLEPDTFEKSVKVWTYEGGEIIEKQCETPGWPNVTHDGQMMYENTFSIDKSKVVGWAKENARLGVELFTERLAEKRKEVSEWEERLRTEEENVRKLNSDYPEVSSAS